MSKCGIHNAKRQALGLADPKNLATALLTFATGEKERGASLRPL
jgi:hypothetical protein